MASTSSPSYQVAQLSVGEQQRVEILKVLYRGAEILILDEPTAVLTPPEAEALLCTLASMRRRGKSVIFISHKLERGYGDQRPGDRAAARQSGRARSDCRDRPSTSWPR